VEQTKLKYKEEKQGCLSAPCRTDITQDLAGRKLARVHGLISGFVVSHKNKEV